LIWAIVLTFMVSLKVSELMGSNLKKFDPLKTLCGADVQMLKVEAQGKSVRWDLNKILASLLVIKDPG
jgi:hypothetical protein